MENECEALPGVAYPGVRDNRSTLNTKTGYDDDESEDAPLQTMLSVTPSSFFLYACEVTCHNRTR